MNFVHHIIDPDLSQKPWLPPPKRMLRAGLQEVAQSVYQVTPTYRTVKEQGPDHAKEFTVEAIIADKTVWAGEWF